MRPPVKLWQIAFPLSAIISILHRITGVILSFGVILCPILLHYLVKDPNILQHGFIWLFVLGFEVALIYHGIMGVKHIIMDCGWFNEPHMAYGLNLSALLIFMLVSIIAVVNYI